ncbi:MAG TPA: hypothetical protein VFS43_12490 [Polyangiaceae bacterium]|nr:hypothetical protein [Polyangiaceae bacterium]
MRAPPETAAAPPRPPPGRVAPALALALAAASAGCGKPEPNDPSGLLPASVQLAVDEQAVFKSAELEDYRIDGAGVVSVATTPKWLVIGGLRPGKTTLVVKQRGGKTIHATVVVTDGPPRRGVEVPLLAGETRLLEVPEVLSYEIRSKGVFQATLESPRLIGVLGVEPGVGTLAVLGKGDAYSLYRVVVRRRPEK